MIVLYWYQVVLIDKRIKHCQTNTATTTALEPRLQNLSTYKLAEIWPDV